MSNNERPNAPENEGQPPLVVAIERQYGSGGREIGALVGKALGIPSFDHTLIDLTAQESGFPPAYVKQHEQEVRRGLLYNLYMQNYRSIGAEPEQMDDMWLAQARAITKLADEGSCVIVGRCAGAILRGRKNVLTVFVHAPLEMRVKHVMERDSLDAKEAEKRIKTIDHERADHSLRFANATWGAAETHHLVLDSSIQSPRDAAKLIANLAKKAFPEAPLSPCPEKPGKKS